MSLNDFWPPREASLSDFYPDNFVFPQKVDPSRKMGPGAAAVLVALAERLKVSLETEIELLTIMEFCESLLRQRGVKFHTISQIEVPK